MVSTTDVSPVSLVSAVNKSLDISARMPSAVIAATSRKRICLFQTRHRLYKQCMLIARWLQISSEMHGSVHMRKVACHIRDSKKCDTFGLQVYASQSEQLHWNSSRSLGIILYLGSHHVFRERRRRPMTRGEIPRAALPETEATQRLQPAPATSSNRTRPPAQ